MILEIGLLILKILGIILVVVLCLALLLLFYPIKYMGNVEVKEKNATYKGTAWWLFHIIHFRIEGENQYGAGKLRVFGIPVYKINFPGEEEEEEEQASSEKEKSDAVSENKVETTEAQVEQKGSGEENPGSFEDEEKIPFTEKVRRITRKIKELWQTVKEAYGASVEKAELAKVKLQDTKKILKAKTTKRAFYFTKEMVIKILQQIRPRKVEGALTFGMEQPDQTGKILGYVSIGCAMFKIPLDRMNITPDFEKKVLDGYLSVKGRILLGIVLVYLLKLYFNRDVKRVMKRLGK
ncbi:MAG: DUF2953 domain-containing protein [Eubacterium sp.]|nr:DUF2953 domain-containing protein [Eubacterium sp.]